jgi:hypothetical protein
MGHVEFENFEVLNAREMSQHLCHRHDCLDWALEDATDQMMLREVERAYRGFVNLEVLNAREMSQHLCHRHDCLDWALEDGTDQMTFRRIEDRIAYQLAE